MLQTGFLYAAQRYTQFKTVHKACGKKINITPFFDTRTAIWDLILALKLSRRSLMKAAQNQMITYTSGVALSTTSLVFFGAFSYI